ncbi:MAG: hypothetical protein LAT51_13515 [Flavobacteriaceae bacterium]|nr:hypothetical protein [Flavobacteriaceae bacterium]
MKKTISLFFLLALVVACSGDRGPMGPQGPQGQAGINILGQVFEVNVNFTSTNDYSAVIDIPQDIEVLESDVIMVYWLEDVISDSTGPIDVWSPLPSIFYINNGVASFDFNHTYFDVNIFLDGNINLDALPDAIKLDQIFRIAVIPADFAEMHPDLNTLNYNQLEDAFKSYENDFDVIDLKN